MEKRTVLIAATLMAALVASLFIIPALAHPYWSGEETEEGEEFVPPCLIGEDCECPYGHEHRNERYEDCPYELEGQDGARNRQWGSGCGMMGSGYGYQRGGNGRSSGSSGRRWGSS